MFENKNQKLPTSSIIEKMEIQFNQLLISLRLYFKTMMQSPINYFNFFLKFSKLLIK